MPFTVAANATRATTDAALSHTPVVSKGDLAVLLAVVNLVGTWSRTSDRLSRAQIAASARVSPKTVTRALAKWAALGVLHYEPSRGRGRLGMVSLLDPETGQNETEIGSRTLTRTRGSSPKEEVVSEIMCMAAATTAAALIWRQMDMPGVPTERTVHAAARRLAETRWTAEELASACDWRQLPDQLSEQTVLGRIRAAQRPRAAARRRAVNAPAAEDDFGAEPSRLDDW